MPTFYHHSHHIIRVDKVNYTGGYLCLPSASYTLLHQLKLAGSPLNSQTNNKQQTLWSYFNG
ncbi:hypothetical protein [uncultured Nostoc sp.]|uniref:hypothetical protein n=1 Tax=uncultured Nostoc sp. TaxID=340711 RepID=UPI0035CBA13C